MKKLLIGLLALGSVSTFANVDNSTCSPKLMRPAFGIGKTNCKIKYGKAVERMLGTSVDMTATELLSLEECLEKAQQGFEELDANGLSYSIAKVKHIDVETCTKTKQTIVR